MFPFFLSPWRSLWVPACPWRRGSRRPPPTGPRWTSRGWRSRPAGWANAEPMKTHKNTHMLWSFPSFLDDKQWWENFLSFGPIPGRRFKFTVVVLLFLTRSHRGLWGAGHPAAATRWRLQGAPPWPRSRSLWAACRCFITRTFDQNGWKKLKILTNRLHSYICLVVNT